MHKVGNKSAPKSLIYLLEKNKFYPNLPCEVSRSFKNQLLTVNILSEHICNDRLEILRKELNQFSSAGVQFLMSFQER